MTRGGAGRPAPTLLLVLLTLAAGCNDDGDLASTLPVDGLPAADGVHEGLLYARVTTSDGDVLEGRIRLGADGEATWGNAFNGTKRGNPWVDDEVREQLPTYMDSVMVLGVRVARRERQMSLDRPFMARYGDLARIDRIGTDLRVTLKSGSEVVLDRMAADDFGSGVRIWDAAGGFVDLGERQIRSIEMRPAPDGNGPLPLHGTVHTSAGVFTGFIQWNREQCLVSDALVALARDRSAFNHPFEAIASIAKRESGGSVVTLVDGQTSELSGVRANLGTYVDDPRYGRVLVSWDAFERVDFRPGGTGPAYEDFPPGRPLAGTVVTRSGRRLTGRLVFDLDESGTVETLDAPSRGVTYTIPFGLIDSVEVPGNGLVSVAMRSGEELELERSGDLGDDNGGMLVFTDGAAEPEYVAWADIGRIDFEAPGET